MSRLPLVSVLIPCYNVERFIEYSLFGLANQNYKNIQIIAVDDSSFDGTLQILHRLLDSPQHKIIQTTQNCGVANALNLAIDNADGDFICRLDADDYPYAWRIHDQVHYLLEHHQIDLIGTGVDLFGQAEGCYRSPLSHREIVDTIMVNNPFIHPTVMFKRRLIDQGIFRYDPELRTEEDYDLWTRIVPQITCANLDQSSTRYRIHASNNQRHPSKLDAKTKILTNFLRQYGITDDGLVASLASFQCSGFIRPNDFEVFKKYASIAVQRSSPRLGWLHDLLLTARNYKEFLYAVR